VSELTRVDTPEGDFHPPYFVRELTFAPVRPPDPTALHIVTAVQFFFSDIEVHETVRVQRQRAQFAVAIQDHREPDDGMTSMTILLYRTIILL